MIEPPQNDVPDLDLSVRSGRGQPGAASIDRPRRNDVPSGP